MRELRNRDPTFERRIVRLVADRTDGSAQARSGRFGSRALHYLSNPAPSSVSWRVEIRVSAGAALRFSGSPPEMHRPQLRRRPWRHARARVGCRYRPSTGTRELPDRGGVLPSGEPYRDLRRSPTELRTRLAQRLAGS